MRYRILRKAKKARISAGSGVHGGGFQMYQFIHWLVKFRSMRGPG